MKFPQKLSLLITLPLLLCGCTGGNAEREDTMSVQYFRLASGQSENYVTNQACTVLQAGGRTYRWFCHYRAVF